MTCRIALVREGRSADDADVLVFLQELLHVLDVGGQLGPPLIFTVVDQQLHAILCRLRFIHLDTFLRVVPVLAAGHHLWSFEGLQLSKWGQVLLRPTMAALGLGTEPKVKALLTNKDHRCDLSRARDERTLV